MDMLPELLEGFRRAGRKGGVVALVLGALFMYGAISESRKPGHMYSSDYQLIEIGVVLGLAGLAGGTWLLVTGGRVQREPREVVELAEALAATPLPYGLCLPCVRVVKSWTVQTCTRCGGDLLDIRTEDDVVWAQDALAARR